MLTRMQNFFKTTLLGGIIVVLPAVILILAFKWLFGVIGRAIAPLTNLVVDHLRLPDRYDELIATAIVLTVTIMICFMIGLFVRTRLGLILYTRFENAILAKAPGYRLVKETVTQILGRKEMPFASVALAQPFGNDTWATAFITDRHPNGMVTVFIPTGPNPTTGFVYHLNADRVKPVAISVEEAMRSVISCGAGSGELIRRFAANEK